MVTHGKTGYRLQVGATLYAVMGKGVTDSWLHMGKLVTIEGESMSNATDLRDRAERLREALPTRQAAAPPTENGRRIGTIERSATEEIRVNWSEYEGKPFLSIRMWKRSDDGAWWPDKRGIAIRVRELPGLAAAIAEALDIAEADVRQWREQQARRPAGPMPGRRVGPATLPLRSQEVFDEFAENQP